MALFARLKNLLRHGTLVLPKPSMYLMNVIIPTRARAIKGRSIPYVPSNQERYSDFRARYDTPIGNNFPWKHRIDEEAKKQAAKA
jgi:hypothetical protein